MVLILMLKMMDKCVLDLQPLYSRYYIEKGYQYDGNLDDLLAIGSTIRDSQAARDFYITMIDAHMIDVNATTSTGDTLLHIAYRDAWPKADIDDLISLGAGASLEPLSI